MNSSRDQFNKQAALYAASHVHRFGPSLPVLVQEDLGKVHLLFSTNAQTPTLFNMLKRGGRE